MAKTFYFLLAVVLATLASSGQNTNKEFKVRAQAMSASGKVFVTAGSFIKIKGKDGAIYRVYKAGQDNAKVGILFVHDFFGISNSTKESIERLGALGYLAIAVDLYKGKAATDNEAASVLMQAKDSAETERILRAGIDYLKRPGRKLASIGFSAGGIDALKAALMEPELFGATAIVYGGGYENLEKSQLDKLKNPLLAIMGTLDNWPVQSALSFFAGGKNKSFEMYFYPGADHGYAQPLFNGGKNYNVQASRVTWMLLEDFLARNLKSASQ